MAFQFSLAAVLRYREGLEQKEYLALEKLQQEVALCAQKLTQIEEAGSAAAENRKAELEGSILAADLKSAYEYQAALERQRQLLITQLNKATHMWQQQLRVYESARRSRETLDKLRSQQLDAYKRETAKREQIALDDIFLSRRARRQ